MAKHNYSQYSNNKKNETAVAEPKAPQKTKLVPADLTDDVLTPEVKMVTETVETVKIPKTITGEVANCFKLNIRVAPVANARIESIVDVGTNLVINVSESTDDWFKVTTESGVNGYCMKKFVDARL